MGAIQLRRLSQQFAEARAASDTELRHRDRRPVDRIERLRRAWRGRLDPSSEKGH